MFQSCTGDIHKATIALTTCNDIGYPGAEAKYM